MEVGWVMDKKQEAYEKLKKFFNDAEADAFIRVLKDLRSLERIESEGGRMVLNETYLNSPLFSDVCDLCVLLQKNRIMGQKAAEEIFKGVEKKLEEAQETIEKLKALNEGQKSENGILKSENSSLKKELEEMKAANKELQKYLDIWKQRTADKETEAQAYLDYASELEDEKEKKRQSMVCNGKALELPPRVIKEVIRQWCLGVKIKQIQADTGASRGQIERIVKGRLKHKESIKKVVKCINQLLKVNQNAVFIEKLKGLKAKYN